MDDLVQEWLAKAEEDWDSARVLLGDESPLVTPALFHMQQCAEKLLKALLIKKKVYFERRHDLSYLLRLANEAELLCYSRLLNELNPSRISYQSLSINHK
jgi:HEPN domain-containing protein